MANVLPSARAWDDEPQACFSGIAIGNVTEKCSGWVPRAALSSMARSGKFSAGFQCAASAFASPLTTQNSIRFSPERSRIRCHSVRGCGAPLQTNSTAFERVLKTSRVRRRVISEDLNGLMVGFRDVARLHSPLENRALPVTQNVSSASGLPAQNPANASGPRRPRAHGESHRSSQCTRTKSPTPIAPSHTRQAKRSGVRSSALASRIR